MNFRTTHAIRPRNFTFSRKPLVVFIQSSFGYDGSDIFRLTFVTLIFADDNTNICYLYHYHSR